MDARKIRLALLASAVLLLASVSSHAATFSTANFVVNAPDAEFARQVGQTAERCRVELAREWLGRELPKWFRPCRVNVTVGQIGAGGATTFTFAAGQVFGWNMNIQGTPERILDSVIPHEVSHTIFASYFRRPLPRWADEGAATLVEHESERRRQELLLKQVFNTPQRIPLSKLMSIMDYPSDMQNVLTLYAQAYSLASYLVQSGGRARYLNFLTDAHMHNWNYAIKKNYGLDNVTQLERRWTDWVYAGSPELPNNQMLADASARALKKKGITVRSQNPDTDESASQLPQVSRAARPAKPVPQQEELAAPRPTRPPVPVAVAERAIAERTGDLESERIEAAARRLEGRERSIREGWQPVAQTESSRELAVPREGDLDSAPATTNESSARRRFRDAKSRHAANASDPNAREDPFAAPQPNITDRDIADAQSPFHVEN